MNKKFSYSRDRQNWNGEYPTREEAIEAAIGNAEPEAPPFFWVGQNNPPPAPENRWDAEDWVENVLCMDEYSSDAADGSLPVTKEQGEELESIIRPILGLWLDKHDLRPNFWLVEFVKEYDMQGKEVEPTP